MIERSRYIKFNWLSNDERLCARVDELSQELLGGLLRNRKRDLTSAFNTILTSIDVLGGFDGWWIRIPTNNNLFTGKTRRNASYTTDVLYCLDWLIKNHYLAKVDGLRAPRTKSHKTYFLPNAYVVAPKISEVSLVDPATVYRNPLASYIEVRDNINGVKRQVAIDPLEETKYGTMLANVSKLLPEYDQLMRNTDIAIGTSKLNSNLFSMTRIFSRGSLTHGGRYYSPMQNMRSNARQYLRFNGDPTVEIDFSAIHPTMLYQCVNQELINDPYTIEEWERSDVKVAFNIMLNRDGGDRKSSAANAIAQHLEVSRDKAKELEQTILKHHQPIAEFFNTGVGLELQWLDSRIITYILQHFVRVIQRPIFTVHDSAVVSVRDTETLRLAMEAGYEEVMSNDLPSVQTFIRAIKVESLPFTDELDALIVQSLDGSLEQYDESYWSNCIDKNMFKECPKELLSTKYSDEAQ